MASGRLVFDGDVELLDSVASDDGYWFEAVEGISFGQPVPVEAILTSLLRDGSLVSKTGDDNREVAIPFRVCGSDLLALAAGEKRIGLAIGKRTTLEWTPSDGIGPTTVFDVMTSNLDNPPMDDLAELRNRRTYTLRLTCLPFGRSVDKIVDSAGTPPADGGTVVNSCETVSEWYSGSGNYPSLSPAQVDSTVFYEGSGSIKTYPYDFPVYNSDYGYWTASHNDNWTGSIATGSGGYLSILVRYDWNDVITSRTPPFSNTLSIRVYSTAVPNGRSVFPTPSETLPGGWVRLTWPVDAGIVITKMEIGALSYSVSGSPSTPFVHYDAISLSESATTEHQIVKQIDVQGSARAPGALHVSAPSDSAALGQVLAVTVPSEQIASGFQPDVRRWVTSGATTTDASALHGSYFAIPTSWGGGTFDIPVPILTPGPHTLVVLGKTLGSGMVTLAGRAQLKVGGNIVGPESIASASLPGNPEWSLFTLGTIYLPPLPMQSPDSSAVVQVDFQGDFSLADAYVIPEAADFSIVDCGTGTVSGSGASSNLWIDSPSPSQPQGGWWRGPTPDRANSRSAWPDAKWPGRHAFDPGMLTAFLVSTGAQGPILSLEYFPHWRTNAAL